MSYRRLLEHALYLHGLVELLASSGLAGCHLTPYEGRRVEEIAEELKDARLALEARRFVPEGWSVIA